MLHRVFPAYHATESIDSGSLSKAPSDKLLIDGAPTRSGSSSSSSGRSVRREVKGFEVRGSRTSSSVAGNETMNVMDDDDGDVAGHDDGTPQCAHDVDDDVHDVDDDLDARPANAGTRSISEPHVTRPNRPTRRLFTSATNIFCQVIERFRRVCGSSPVGCFFGG